MTICIAPGCSDEAKYIEHISQDEAHDDEEHEFTLCKRHIDPTHTITEI